MYSEHKTDMAETLFNTAAGLLPYPEPALLDQQRLTLSALSFQAGLSGALLRLLLYVSPESGLLQQSLFIQRLHHPGSPPFVCGILFYNYILYRHNTVLLREVKDNLSLSLP